MATLKFNPIPHISQQNIDRFWLRVDKTPGQGPRGECWTWTPRCKEYGVFIVIDKLSEGRSQKLRAHRISYFLEHREDPGNLLVCHSCDFRICVRGSHLFKGTHAQNTADMYSKGRAAIGDLHPARTNPSYLLRGADHWTNKHPEKNRGESNPSSVLTWEKVDEIRALRACGISCATIAQQFSVSRGTVGRIVAGRMWKESHRPL